MYSDNKSIAQLFATCKRGLGCCPSTPKAPRFKRTTNWMQSVVNLYLSGLALHVHTHTLIQT